MQAPWTQALFLLVLAVFGKDPFLYPTSWGLNPCYSLQCWVQDPLPLHSISWDLSPCSRSQLELQTVVLGMGSIFTQPLGISVHSTACSVGYGLPLHLISWDLGSCYSLQCWVWAPSSLDLLGSRFMLQPVVLNVGSLFTWSLGISVHATACGVGYGLPLHLISWDLGSCYSL